MTEENQKEEKKQKKQVETKEPVEFIGKDLLESYNYYRNFISMNPVEEYIAKRKCIEFGKELLPTNHKDPKKQEKITKLYDTACTTLQSEIPAKRNIEFSYFSDGSKRYTIYSIKSTDAADCSAEMEKLEEVLENFTYQQHEQHMSELQDMDNQIFHVLVEEGIVLKINPTVDDLIDDWIEEEVTAAKNEFTNKNKREVKTDGK